MKQILKGIWLVEPLGRDCNIYIIDEEIIVDTGTGSNFSAIKNEIEKYIDKKKINKIINTHAHFDHTGGNKKFRDWTKAEIFAHKDDKKLIEKGMTCADLFDEVARAVTVDKELKEGERIKTENFDFRIISTPGHTPGSICLYDKMKKVLISGDTLFDGGVGRTDLPFGNPEDLKKSIDKLSRLDISYLLPGHGSPRFGGIGFLIKQALANQIKPQHI